MSISDLSAQCKYDINEVDPITEERVFRTKFKRISNGVKVKDGISIGFLDVGFAQTAQGNVIRFEGNTKNPQARPMFFMFPGDSLYLKFQDKTLVTLPPLGMPTQHMNAFNGKPMITFEYVLSKEVMDKFRAGEVVQFMRISNNKQNWDFTEFTTDMGLVFRECWL